MSDLSQRRFYIPGAEPRQSRPTGVSGSGTCRTRCVPGTREGKVGRLVFAGLDVPLPSDQAPWTDIISEHFVRDGRIQGDHPVYFFQARCLHDGRAAGVVRERACEFDDPLLEEAQMVFDVTEGRSTMVLMAASALLVLNSLAKCASQSFSMACCSGDNCDPLTLFLRIALPHHRSE